jgi:hypothetical protein
MAGQRDLHRVSPAKVHFVIRNKHTQDQGLSLMRSGAALVNAAVQLLAADRKSIKYDDGP